MAFVVISYPRIFEEDYSWIQGIRSQYDSRYQLLAPHFTFVFPCSLQNPADLIEHVRKKTQKVKQISFIIQHTITVKNSMSGQYHLFLVPNEGLEAFTWLHDNFYTGLLAAKLRQDIPFIPHITIGDGLDLKESGSLVEKLNKPDMNIKGIVDFLEVACYEEQKIQTLERIRLEE
jgi:2'-5' RNA ligase